MRGWEIEERRVPFYEKKESSVRKKGETLWHKHTYKEEKTWFTKDHRKRKGNPGGEGRAFVYREKKFVFVLGGGGEENVGTRKREKGERRGVR